VKKQGSSLCFHDFDLCRYPTGLIHLLDDDVVGLCRLNQVDP
jgi:acyl CoA:acetate/3-ketoacid CoA transferase alpha subunit